jgi:hypothetical protein
MSTDDFKPSVSLSNSLRAAAASVAWADATTPEQSRQMRQMFDIDLGAETYDTVLEKFGPRAAKAWQQAQNARLDFFKAVEDPSSKEEPDEVLGDEILHFFKRIVEIRNGEKDSKDYEQLEKALDALSQHSAVKAQREHALQMLAELEV